MRAETGRAMEMKEGGARDADATVDTLIKRAEKLPDTSRARRFFTHAAMFIALLAPRIAEGANYEDKPMLGIGPAERAAVAEQRLEYLYREELRLSRIVARERQTLESREREKYARPEDVGYSTMWATMEDQQQLRRDEGRLAVLERRIHRNERILEESGAKWANKRAKVEERREEKAKATGREVRHAKVIDVGARANEETDALLSAWGIIVRGNVIGVPNGDGTIEWVVADASFIDVAFYHRGNHLKIVYETTKHAYNTVDVQYDSKLHEGIYNGVAVTDEKGNPL